MIAEFNEKTTGKKAGLWRRAFSIFILLALLAAAAGSVLNRLVVLGGGDRIVTEDEAARLDGVDCILVLGAGVYANKYPSAMLEDRLLEGVRLYRLGVSDRLLMSGDNGRINYNEVKVMKDFAVRSGVPSRPRLSGPRGLLHLREHVPRP